MPNIKQEKFAAKRFLTAIGLPEATLLHRDKPDFLIQSNTRQIGLEVCTASPEELLRVVSILDQWEGCIFPGTLQHRGGEEKRRPTAELIDEATDASGPWQDFEDVHERWRLGIEHRLSDKQRAFINAGFSRFDENWLLIYDLEVAPISHEIDVSYVKRNLEKLRASFKPVDYFDKVWIDLGEQGGLIEWTIQQSTIVWRGVPIGDASI